MIAATGVLTPQEELDPDPALAAQMIEVNFTSHVTTLLAAAGKMRAQGNGTIVVLSSVAAIRPRKANYVYGAAKAGLDAFARGLTDALRGHRRPGAAGAAGVRHGRMTAGMSPAPLSSTPAQVGAAVAAALEGQVAAGLDTAQPGRRGRRPPAGAATAVAQDAQVKRRSARTPRTGV